MSCGLLLLLASRWFVVVWEVQTIVPLPLLYGIGVLPILTLGAAMLPMVHDDGGGSCLCGARCRQVFSVLCATLDATLSLGLAVGLVYVAENLATEPDQRLNIYWSGTLRLFIYVLMASILGAFVASRTARPPKQPERREANCNARTGSASAIHNARGAGALL